MDYVPRFCSGLTLNGEVQSRAVEILRLASERELTSGRGPTGVAAAAIYIASILSGERADPARSGGSCRCDRSHYPEPVQGTGRETGYRDHSLIPIFMPISRGNQQLIFLRIETYTPHQQRARRSGVDRYVRNVEAAGSNPAGSMRFSHVHPLILRELTIPS